MKLGYLVFPRWAKGIVLSPASTPRWCSQQLLLHKRISDPSLLILALAPIFPSAIHFTPLKCNPFPEEVCLLPAVFSLSVVVVVGGATIENMGLDHEFSNMNLSFVTTIAPILPQFHNNADQNTQRSSDQMTNVLLLSQMLHVKEEAHLSIREIRPEPRVENNVRGPLYREFAHLRQFLPMNLTPVSRSMSSFKPTFMSRKRCFYPQNIVSASKTMIYLQSDGLVLSKSTLVSASFSNRTSLTKEYSFFVWNLFHI